MTIAKTLPHRCHQSSCPRLWAGGLAAGIIDGASAFHTFGSRMPYGIASSLLGSKAFPATGGGGPAIWSLGLVLHFVVAFGAAGIYCLASRRYPFLGNNFLLGGVIRGMAVFLGMNLLMLPLSAIPVAIGPFSVAALRFGLCLHIIWVGRRNSINLWCFFPRAAAKLAKVPPASPR